MPLKTCHKLYIFTVTLKLLKTTKTAELKKAIYLQERKCENWQLLCLIFQIHCCENDWEKNNRILWQEKVREKSSYLTH